MRSLGHEGYVHPGVRSLGHEGYAQPGVRSLGHEGYAQPGAGSLLHGGYALLDAGFLHQGLVLSTLRGDDKTLKYGSQLCRVLSCPYYLEYLA